MSMFTRSFLLIDVKHLVSIQNIMNIKNIAHKITAPFFNKRRKIFIYALPFLL